MEEMLFKGIAQTDDGTVHFEVWATENEDNLDEEIVGIYEDEFGLIDTEIFPKNEDLDCVVQWVLDFYNYDVEIQA